MTALISPVRAASPPRREQDLAAALYQAAAGAYPQAIAALRRLAEQHPHWDEPPLRLGECLRAKGEPQLAMAAYQRALGRNPHRPEALLALGALLLTAGRPGEAESVLRRACAVASPHPHALHAHGLSLLLLGQPASAFETLTRAYASDPANALCGVHLADAAHALGATADLLAQLERQRRGDPANAALLTACAAALAHLGRRAEAIDALEAATLLQPACPTAAALFADMLARSTRQTDAEPALRHALALDPDNHDASMALSVVLMRLHRYTESVDLLQALLALPHGRPGVLCNLATALVALGRQQEAVNRARQAIALAPDHPAPRRALCNALPYHPHITGADLLAAASACAARQPRAALPTCRTNPDPNRRLRLGLLSGVLRSHPVGWLTVAGFEHLDPAAFELICLTPNPPEDAIGRRFAAVASRWEDTGSLDDRELAERARALQLDIVIDLGGYGDFGRMQACAHRLAPVQVKWVGMQNHSTGLAEMDWFISDRWETPPALAPLYSERLMILRDGYVCYTPPGNAPEPASLPALASGALTFGCYNNLAKITPAVIAVWSRILRALPTARLILKTHQFNSADTRAALRAAFAAHAIAADRLELRGSSPHRELLRQYGDIDIVLDPFPYSGGLTTCEALWMGVPTLTMPGETFAARHSASHMSNVGLEDWIVADDHAYVAQAVSRAADLPSLALLRAGLRARMRHSPLCDAPRFGAALGVALRDAWQDWCATQTSPPDLHG